MESMTYDWKSGTQGLMKAFNSAPSFIRSSFLLKGNSADILRRVALSVSNTIQEDQRIPFMGVMKSFALRVPAFSSQNAAVQALDALMESVECAAGYYSIYKGIIFLEFAREWCETRDLETLGKYLNYIQVNRNHICFIILIPTLNAPYLEEFILQYGVFHVVEVREPSLEQLSGMFKVIAQEKGYTVSPPAEKILLEKTKIILASKSDYPTVIENMVEKAVFYHAADGKADRYLKERDIERLTVPGGVAYDKPFRQIGFARGD